jgi:hypothetical protein
MEWLKMIAPTIATAIGGPFGTMAYGLIAHELGITTDEAQKTIEAGKLTADQIASVQLAEVAIKAKAQELKLDFEQLATADRKSARDMQTATKSYTPAVLSAVVIGGFIAITTAKVMGYAVASDPMIQDLLTTLRDGVILILAFYFGSSSNDQHTTELLHHSTPTK